MLIRIQNEIEKLEKIRDRIKTEIQGLPKGKLRCTSSNGTEQFYVDASYTSKKERVKVRGIAQREYYEKTLPVLSDYLKKLYELERLYEKQVLEDCYMAECETRKKLITPVIDTVEQRVKNFLEETYLPGKFDEENKTEFYTKQGVRVRSKSELIIADELDRNQIPYLYEKPLELTDWGKSIVVRPDFTVMNVRNGKVFIYEHLGMMDDLEYVEKNMKKLELYEKNGYLLGVNLLVTHETSSSPLNVKILDSYIENYLL